MLISLETNELDRRRVVEHDQRVLRKVLENRGRVLEEERREKVELSGNNSVARSLECAPQLFADFEAQLRKVELSKRARRARKIPDRQLDSRQQRQCVE